MEAGSSATAPSHTSVAAECVICGTALAGPVAVVLGLDSAFAALGTNVLAVLDLDPIRILLMVLAILGTGANLYTVWHGHRLHERAAEDRYVALTRLESRQAFAVVALACLTVVFIVFEMVAHAYLH